MKILLQSAGYWPQIGGIETIARLLAEEFLELGHAPFVITDAAGPADGTPGIRVLRQGSLALRATALREADVALMFGVSLRFLPLSALMRRPAVISHQTWYDRGVSAALKRGVSRFTCNIAASEAIARALRAPATVIANPYDDRVFVRRDEARTRDLVFVGRIVSDKGLPVLIEALARLAPDGLRPTLTVIGSGGDEQRCREAAAAAAVDRQIEWAGSLSGEALALALNRHRVLVVPSVWREPFGIVALEGLACGCAVVGSGGGGLPEAIGPGGWTFPNGDAAALADVLRGALMGAGVPDAARVDAHLRRHGRRVIAERYLDVLRAVAR